jgi:hypothetical protein
MADAAVPPGRQADYEAAIAAQPGGNPFERAAYAQMLRVSLAADEVIREHLETHTLLEWVTEVRQLRDRISSSAPIQTRAG